MFSKLVIWATLWGKYFLFAQRKPRGIPGSPQLFKICADNRLCGPCAKTLIENSLNTFTYSFANLISWKPALLCLSNLKEGPDS